VSLRVDYDERAISQAPEFLDDPQGIRTVLDAIDRLADDPRPAGSFPYGSPDLRRLRVGRYRVLYEITEQAVASAHRSRHCELTQPEDHPGDWYPVAGRRAPATAQGHAAETLGSRRVRVERRALAR
jgi:mRNA interferase RelE/StbE